MDLLSQTVSRFDVRLLGYCVMPNHWHLILMPGTQTELSRAMHWLTSTHTRRWALAHTRPGPGHIYQGRFRSVPVQSGMSLSRLLRYVERNALESELVGRAEEWPWCSAHQRRACVEAPALLPQPFLPEDDWLDHLNAPARDADLAVAIRRNLPIGDPAWVKSLRDQAGPVRRPGRPRK